MKWQQQADCMGLKRYTAGALNVLLADTETE